MKKSRSIILAVVSAKNDLNNQIVTKMARSIDPDGKRTLGIITKPDTLHAGSNSEKEFYALAQNKEVKFDLGWHVVVNRDFNTRNITNSQRDDTEKIFFNKGIWASLSKNHVGVDALRARLSRVLRDQILNELPGLIADVDAGIVECTSRLSQLGVSRGTSENSGFISIVLPRRFLLLSELLSKATTSMISLVTQPLKKATRSAYVQSLRISCKSTLKS